MCKNLHPRGHEHLLQCRRGDGRVGERWVVLLVVRLLVVWAWFIGVVVVYPTLSVKLKWSKNIVD